MLSMNAHKVLCFCRSINPDTATLPAPASITHSWNAFFFYVSLNASVWTHHLVKRWLCAVLAFMSLSLSAMCSMCPWVCCGGTSGRYLYFSLPINNLKFHRKHRWHRSLRVYCCHISYTTTLIWQEQDYWGWKWLEQRHKLLVESRSPLLYGELKSLDWFIDCGISRAEATPGTTVEDSTWILTTWCHNIDTWAFLLFTSIKLKWRSCHCRHMPVSITKTLRHCCPQCIGRSFAACIVSWPHLGTQTSLHPVHAW